MHRNLLLGLVIVVLFGALAGGNPFLPGRSDRAKPRGAAPVPLSPAATEPLVEVGVERPATNGLAGLRAGLPLATPVSLRAAAGGEGAGEAALLPCPDPALQALVVDVQRGFDGEPVWVLRDGRRLRRAKSQAADGALRPGPAPAAPAAADAASFR